MDLMDRAVEALMSDGYTRLYHRFAEEFPDVWADDRAFGVWTRLLMLADASWPMRPHLPRSVRPRMLARLKDAGLLIVTGDTYTIRGLDAERTRRRDAARTGAAKRWESERNANADATAMPSKAKQRQDEPSNGAAHESMAGYDGRADLEAFLLLTRKAPTVKQRKVMDDVLQLHDLSGPQWAADIMLRHPDDPIGALIEADKAWRQERVEAAKSQEHEPVRRRRGSGMTGINAELAAYYRQLEKERETTDVA
jgi:hypothetical protein